MRILIDTGVLLRRFNPIDPQYPAIDQAIGLLKAAGHEFVVSIQNIAEFWNVTTRPTSARGGYGYSIAIADQRLAFIENLAEILPFTMAAYSEWRKLLVAHQIMGLSVHDARLVATMIVENVPTILTLNGRDFQRYAQVQAISPDDVQ